jgi:hypothetical protein
LAAGIISTMPENHFSWTRLNRAQFNRGATVRTPREATLVLDSSSSVS